MTGKQLFVNVPESVCEECDLSVEAAKKVISKFDKNKIKLEVKPYFNNIFKMLLKGGWHPPLVIVNGKIFSQGIVPDSKKFESRIKEELKK